MQYALHLVNMFSIVGRVTPPGVLGWLSPPSAIPISECQADDYDQLLETQLGDAEAWYRQQKAILTRRLKTKAPDAWRNARYGAIKQGMKKLGVEKDTYYPDVAARLKMKTPFDSLTKLTKRDLDRVYIMVLRDVGDAQL